MAVKPPLFSFQINKRDLMHFSYARYLENKIREGFGFEGTSIKFVFREKGERENGYVRDKICHMGHCSLFHRKHIAVHSLLGKAKGVDIKKERSGNAGTTNALRVLGKKAAVITLIIDVCKGVLAVYLGTGFGNYTIGTVCALAVFCGHVWPCFYRFKGGKGVATAFESCSGGSMVALGAHGTSGGSHRIGGNSEDVGRLFAGRRSVSAAVLAVRAGIFAGGLCDGRNNNYQTYT